MTKISQFEAIYEYTNIGSITNSKWDKSKKTCTEKNCN